MNQGALGGVLAELGVCEQTGGSVGVGLYTIFPSPIVYGVWYKNRVLVGGRILRNGRPIVLQ